MFILQVPVEWPSIDMALKSRAGGQEKFFQVGSQFDMAQAKNKLPSRHV